MVFAATKRLSGRKRRFWNCKLTGCSDVDAYAKEHNLPVHMLSKVGFPSIGCAPCTAVVSPGDDERAGRWVGRGKTECGLHTEMFHKKAVAEIASDFRLDVSGMIESKN